MAEDKPGDGKPGFTVKDRRGFAESGDAREPEPAAAPESSLETEAATDFAPVDFHTFILSLGSSALLHLGELDHPDGEPSTPDLPMAKHTIDIIAMLEEKTKGNLSAPEARLVESLLFDLRLRYVERSKSRS